MSNYQEKIDALWAGTVSNFSINIAKSELYMSVDVLEHNIVSHYTVDIEGITEIKYKNKLTDPWDYIELTSMEVSWSDNEWNVSIDFWDVAFLKLKSSVIKINSENLTRTD